MINIHSWLLSQDTNGPGLRFTLWTQGCTKACKGCFNPETWADHYKTQNSLHDPKEFADFIAAFNVDGITLTGGDPLEQPEELLVLLKELHKDDPFLNKYPKGIICFTGYTIEEIEQIPAAKECLEYIDLLIEGRFIEELKYSNGLSGSTNQRFIFSNKENRGKVKISIDDISIDQSVEIHVTECQDEFSITGFPSIDRNRLKELGIRVL